MVIYFAGVDGHKTLLYHAVRYGARHLMLSYHYRDDYSAKQMRRFRELGLHLFLDSGAFSAWKSGAEINIDDYIRYIKENQFGKYIVLDVVGDPEQTAYNQQYMESQGLLPVPVYHMQSDISELHKLIDKGYQYICLGGTVGSHRATREAFFDKCFDEVKGKDIYFHGLGVTDPQIMLKYKWASVDSTTWLIGAKFGEHLQKDFTRVKLGKEVSREDKVRLNVETMIDIGKRAL
jgi:hypothetical protein